jgi:hypothetical protein
VHLGKGNDQVQRVDAEEHGRDDPGPVAAPAVGPISALCRCAAV